MVVTVLIIVVIAGKVRAETSVSDGFYDVIVVVTSLRQQRAVSHVGPPRLLLLRLLRESSTELAPVQSCVLSDRASQQYSYYFFLA